MLELWVPITILAAAAQTARSACQKAMQPTLGTIGASYIRFLYALPCAWLGVFAYQYYAGVDWPSAGGVDIWAFWGDWATVSGTNLDTGGTVLDAKMGGAPRTFWIWVTLGGVMQALFTVLLVALFTHRSFAASTAFSKTEVVQVAVFEALILGVTVSLIAGGAIILGAGAVVMLSLARINWGEQSILRTVFSMQTLIGLGCGGCLGLSSVFFKAAILELHGGDWLLRATYTAAVAVLIQTVLMGGVMAVATPKALKLCFIHWRRSVLAGVFGAGATAAWFMAFALHSVAAVRAVGQIELLITIGLSLFYFQEKINRWEVLAILMLALSIIVIVLA